jgi:hypothetical protein
MDAACLTNLFAVFSQMTVHATQQISNRYLVSLALECGDLGIAELFLLSLKWLLEQRHHVDVFA